jgi:hypothetical protein
MLRTAQLKPCRTGATSHIWQTANPPEVHTQITVNFNFGGG